MAASARELGKSTRMAAFSLVLVVGVSVVASGCGDAKATKAQAECEWGNTSTCTDGSGCSGERECDSDGYYGACVCNEPGTVEPVETDAGTTVTEQGALGGACATDPDCPMGALCLAVDSALWFGGAPTEGICVADCSVDRSVCDTFDNAVCVSAEKSAGPGVGAVQHSLCLPACRPGEGSLSEMACASVAGTLCEPLSESGSGFCRPVCSFDAQCGSGHCDRQLGICVSEATSYAVPFGSACTAEEGTCDGVCVELSKEYSVCSERCAFGTTRTDCAMSDTIAVTAVCGYAAAGAGLGDLGYCAEMCNCDDECTHPEFVCDPFSSMEMRTALGYVGLCAPPIDSSGVVLGGTACRG